VCVRECVWCVNRYYVISCIVYDVESEVVYMVEKYCSAFEQTSPGSSQLCKIYVNIVNYCGACECIQQRNILSVN
jgi:hypothetical protein